MEGGMSMEKNSLIKIRKEIEGLIGTRVILRANKGRKRIVKRKGVIVSAHPSLFVVEVGNDFGGGTRKVSYTYTDVLTGTVEVTIRANQKQSKIS